MNAHTITQVQATLGKIMIYPIKSLDGVYVNRAKISTGGALEFDRRWAIIDEQGKIVNAKRTAKIQRLRSQFDLELGLVSLQSFGQNSMETFCLTRGSIDLVHWLSEFFGFRITIIENRTTGFPDDLAAYGPTLISLATLEMICTWFPELDINEVRRRFRTNLELTGVEAFWEDRLFSNPESVVNFQLGDVEFTGINPCQRCIVPTRNSQTGVIYSNFQKIFNQQRQQTFPTWVNPARFNHFYRLAVNTQIPLVDTGKFLNTGDILS